MKLTSLEGRKRTIKPFEAKLNAWYDNSYFKTLERITGFYETEFPSRNGSQAFVDACDAYWFDLSVRDKAYAVADIMGIRYDDVEERIDDILRRMGVTIAYSNNPIPIKGRRYSEERRYEDRRLNGRRGRWGR